MKNTLKPNSRPQEQLYESSEYEILYGGAAGGGKTSALVVDPLRYICYSQFTGINFRRTFPSGAYIRLGHMEHKEDWRQYQGHQCCYRAYDELTNFHKDQYFSLNAWNRSGAPGIHAYTRAASNPGGIGHAWVKEYFVETCKPEKDGAERYSNEARIHWQPMSPGPTYWYFEPDVSQFLRARLNKIGRG